MFLKDVSYAHLHFQATFIRIYFKMLFIPVVGEFLAAMQSSVSRDPSEIIC